MKLEIQDGGVIAIMGSSESGKSTLLNILGCMDTLTSGQYIHDSQVAEFAHRIIQIEEGKIVNK